MGQLLRNNKYVADSDHSDFQDDDKGRSFTDFDKVVDCDDDGSITSSLVVKQISKLVSSFRKGKRTRIRRTKRFFEC